LNCTGAAVRHAANVAFRASVGRGDFTIGCDFTSAAVGYNDAWTRESAAGT